MAKDKSILLNWHRHLVNNKRMELGSCPVVPRKTMSGGLELTITNHKNERLRVELNETDTKYFFLNLDRFYHGKDVKREDYGLIESEL